MGPRFRRIRCVLFFACVLVALPVHAEFRRIVTLNPLVAEWTAEILGPESAKGRIIGTSEYSDHPAVLKSIATVGPYPRLNLERIVGLKPDLVLGSIEYNLPEQVERLNELGLRVVVLPKETFSRFGEWILTLGGALGDETGAKRAKARWDQALSALARPGTALNAGRDSSYFLEVQHEPLIAVGGQSFITEALEGIGLKNVFRELKSGYPKVSLEAVLKADPGQIFILSHEQGETELARSKREWARFGSLKAVRSGKITVLSGDDFARCSLRLLNALKKLNYAHDP